MNQQLTRRSLLVAGVTAASAMAMSGCSLLQQNERKYEEPNPVEFDYSTQYLPLGSIVKLKSIEIEGLRVMIVARRPYQEGGTYPDYLGVFYPFGFLTFPEEDAFMDPLFYFMTDDIEQVDFVGFHDIVEAEANRELKCGELEEYKDFAGYQLLLPLWVGFFEASGSANNALQSTDIDTNSSETTTSSESVSSNEQAE